MVMLIYEYTNQVKVYIGLDEYIEQGKSPGCELTFYFNYSEDVLFYILRT